MGDKKRREDLIDEAVDESFPASDPPSFMGGAAVAGPPPKKGPREAAPNESSKTAKDTEPAKPRAKT
ncbi:MAG TPA: hypothetical protein VH414_21605 [Lichenihabitans sp.]|jgi:hypothetical protein|nr:hypothetical protein [Lichenihabitans sp.]